MFKVQLATRRTPDSMRILGVVAFAASWLPVSSSIAGVFDVRQITNNSSLDADLDISGSNVVWHG